MSEGYKDRIGNLIRDARKHRGTRIFYAALDVKEHLERAVVGLRGVRDARGAQLSTQRIDRHSADGVCSE